MGGFAVHTSRWKLLVPGASCSCLRCHAEELGIFPAGLGLKTMFSKSAELFCPFPSFFFYKKGVQHHRKQT